MLFEQALVELVLFGGSQGAVSIELEGITLFVELFHMNFFGLIELHSLIIEMVRTVATYFFL